MAFLPGIFNRSPAPAPAPAAAAQPAAAPAPGQTGSLNMQPSGSPQASQQQQPANPGAFPANMANLPSGQAPAGGPESGTPVGLDAFAGMFQKPQATGPDGKPLPAAPSLNDPFLQPFDANTFRPQVAQSNFVAQLPQEVMQKALSGDTQAFQQALNHAAQEAFFAASQLSHGLAEHGARTAAERINGSLDSRIRNHNVRTHTIDNEALAHPAVAPMFQLARQQLAQANPQWSAEQVHQKATEYFSAMADGLVPKTAGNNAAQPQTPSEPNFSHYLA